MQRPLPQSPSRFSIVALAGALALVAACKRQLPPPDPDGKDLVVGAIVAATETAGGIRVYKITQLDTIPDPAGDEYHMVAYDPKTTSWEDAAALYRDKKLKIALPHILVRKVLFMTRDHRIVGAEPVTDEEKLAIRKAQR